MRPELVIYLPFVPETKRTCRALDTIVGIPVIRYAAERLARGFPRIPLTVVYHDDATAAAVEHALGQSPVHLWKASGAGFFAALNEYYKATQFADALLIFLAEAPFPDCARAQRMLEVHARGSAACTIVTGAPFGLVPLILQASVLPYLLDFDNRLRSGMHPLASVCIDLLMQEHSAERVLGLDINYVRETGGERESLPEHVTVCDRFTRSAAESVAAHIGDGSLDSTAAYRFKVALAIRRPQASAVRRTPRSGALGERPRVLFCSVRDSYAGAEESLFTLLGGLSRAARYQPVLFVQEECILSQKSRKAGIPVEVADFDLGDIGPMAIDYCCHTLRRHSPALVHVDTMLAPALMIAAHTHGIPIVGHVRCVVAPQTRIPQAVHFLDRAIAVSDCVEDSLRRTSFDETKIVRIYDGVDLRGYDPSQYDRRSIRRSAGLPDDAFVVSMIARLHPDKKHELLLRAFDSLREDHRDMYAVIAGATHHQERYAHRLKELVKELGIQERVIFWGFEPEPAKVYAISDLVTLCMPAEGWGRCTVEAMAMGVPVVAPDTGGSLELISHGHDGLLYRAGDSVELARSISSIKCNSAGRVRMQSAARAKASSYSAEKHVSAIEGVYAQILGLPENASLVGPLSIQRRTGNRRPA